MENRRKHDRTRPIRTVYVEDEKGERRLGTVIDASPDGFMLQGEEAHLPGMEFRCTFTLPRTVMFTRDLVFGARCIWCRVGRRANTYQSGFQLVNITSSEREIIGLLLRETVEMR